MADELLETFVRQYIESQQVPEVTFAWQGPDYLLGNIQSNHMLELVASDKQRQFGLDKRDTLLKYAFLVETDVIIRHIQDELDYRQK